jgi:hypothetical protein
MTHAWCFDPLRDAAVRAAEDGRDRPLPTLAEAIASPFADAAERSVPVSKTGEGQSGMRTERVTLEITHHDSSIRPSSWPYEVALRRFRLVEDGESVRVVEEAHFDDLAQVAMERDKLRARVAELEADVNDCNIILGNRWRDAVSVVTGKAAPAASEWRDLEPGEMPQINDQYENRDGQWCLVYEQNISLATLPHRYRYRRRIEAQAASGGGGAQSVSAGTSSATTGDSGQGSRVGSGEPVAWGFATPDGKLIHVSVFEPERDTATVVPLYRQPPQPRGWLTEEERKWIDHMKGNCVLPYAGMACMEAILARSSPPEVVLPTVFSISLLGDRLLVEAQVKKALAAAGVAVKEVPRD